MKIDDMANAFADTECRLLKQLKELGYEPSCIFDVGASNGEWSRAIAKVYPDASYHLFEPLADRLDAYREGMAAVLASRPNFTLHKIGLGDANNERQEMAIYTGGFGSSFAGVERYAREQDRRNANSYLNAIEEFPVWKIDEYMIKAELPQPCVIKMDTQGYELSIIKGGPDIIRRADILLLETWLFQGYGETTPLLHELMAELTKLGHTLVDLGETYRHPSQRLTSVDAVFFSTAFIDRYKADLPNLQWHV